MQRKCAHWESCESHFEAIYRQHRLRTLTRSTPQLDPTSIETNRSTFRHVKPLVLSQMLRIPVWRECCSRLIIWCRNNCAPCVSTWRKCPQVISYRAVVKKNSKWIIWPVFFSFFAREANKPPIYPPAHKVGEIYELRLTCILRGKCCSCGIVSEENCQHLTANITQQWKGNGNNNKRTQGLQNMGNSPPVSSFFAPSFLPLISSARHRERERERERDDVGRFSSTHENWAGLRIRRETSALRTV